MKKIAILTLITSMLIAEVPSAGRPNLGAFDEVNTQLLQNIENHLQGISLEIRNLLKLQDEIEIPSFEADNFEKLRLEINCINTRLDYLIWLLDHSLIEGDY